MIEGDNILAKIASCANNLRRWSGKRTTDFAKEMSQRRQQVKDLMALLVTHTTLGEIHRVDAEIDEIENREETYWEQHNRQNWLLDGDKNTAFFNKKGDQRWKRNKIKGVFNERGTWREDEQETKAVFAAYFQSLFEINGTNDRHPVTDKVQRKVINKMNATFVEAYT